MYEYSANVKNERNCAIRNKTDRCHHEKKYHESTVLIKTHFPLQHPLASVQSFITSMCALA